MDSLITAAARALAAGDPSAALKRVALRDDAPALALRGIAMAQLGDLVRAKALLRRAARAFGPKRGRGPREVRRRRGRDRASPRATWAGRRRRSTRRGRRWKAHGDRAQRRARAVSGGPAPPPDRAHRRGRAYARRAGPRALSLPRRGPSTSWWSRGSRCGASGRRRRALRSLGPRAPRARHGIPALTARSKARSSSLDTPAARLIARRGASPPARGGRGAAGVESIRRGRVAVDVVRGGRHGGPRWRRVPVLSRARTRAGRSVAGRRTEGHARRARILIEARR